MVTTVAPPLWRKLAKCSSKSSRAASVTTANGKTSYRRGSVDLDPAARWSTLCSWYECLPELEREKDTPLFICFIDRTKAYDCVDHTLLWMVLARLVLAVIRPLLDGMRACVRLDDGECSDMFVEQGLRQRRALAPLLFNIFFTVVLRVAEKRFTDDAVITDSVVQLK